MGMGRQEISIVCAFQGANLAGPFVSEFGEIQKWTNYRIARTLFGNQGLTKLSYRLQGKNLRTQEKNGFSKFVCP